MFPLVAGSLAIALAEGQVTVVQGNRCAICTRQKETDNVDSSAER